MKLATCLKCHSGMYFESRLPWEQCDRLRCITCGNSIFVIPCVAERPVEVEPPRPHHRTRDRCPFCGRDNVLIQGGGGCGRCRKREMKGYPLVGEIPEEMKKKREVSKWVGRR